MKTKIYDALKTKFVGVSDLTLNRIADKAAKTVTEEDAIQSYIDSVTFQNVIDSEADYRATKATQSSIENYEKKHGLKDGQAIQGKSATQTDNTGGNADDIPSWAKDILSSFSILRDEQEKQNLKAKKDDLVKKVIELGADKNDTELINRLVGFVPIEINDNVDEKASSIIDVYNSFKKPSGGGGTPDVSKSTKGDDEFEQMLQDIKGKN